MKKLKLLPIALLGSAIGAPAVAQSNVTLYGLVDTGLEYQRSSAGANGPATSSKQVASNGYSTSRIGVRGTEDLGGGLRAFFQLEHGLASDTGTTAGSAFWGRKSVVGLGGPWGSVTLGRDYSPAFWLLYRTDVNAFSMYGNSGTMSSIGATGMVRTNNGINYTSPVISGFRGWLTYSLGDERGTAPKDAGRVLALAGAYETKTFIVGGFHQRRKTVYPAGSTTSENNVHQGIVARVNVGQWSVAGGYSEYDPAGPSTATTGEMKNLWGAVMMKFSVNELRVNLGRITTDVLGPKSARSLVASINFTHFLSKRTNVYAGIGRMSNNELSATRLSSGGRVLTNNGLNSDTTAISAGIRARF